jgi:hypothetical protein
VPRTRCPRAALSRATCHPNTRAAAPRPRAGFSRLLHDAPPPPELPRLPPVLPAPACAHGDSLGFKTRPQLLPDLLNPCKGSLSTATSSPKLSSSPERSRSSCPPSSAAYAASRSRSSAPAAPPRPTEAHRANQFQFPPPKQPDRSAGELKLRRRSASPSTSRYKAPQPQPRAPVASIAASSPSSGPLATGTPLPHLEAPPAVPVRHRTAASALLCPNSDHPRDRRESLVISPHLPLAAGEPSRRVFGHRRAAPLLNPDQGLNCKGSNSSTDLSVEKQYPFPIQNSQLVKSIRNCRKIQKLPNQFC